MQVFADGGHGFKRDFFQHFGVCNAVVLANNGSNSNQQFFVVLRAVVVMRMIVRMVVPVVFSLVRMRLHVE